MIIRLAEDSDIPHLTNIKNFKKQEDIKASEERQFKRIQETKEGKANYLVYEDNGEILGHVLLKFYGSKTAPDYPEIEDLYIIEDKRGQGIGTQLINVCEQIAKEHNFTKIGIAANPELNPKARQLYKRLGYTDVGRKPYLSGVYDGVEDWVIDMAKEL